MIDIVKGKLSKAVYLTEVNNRKFHELQRRIKDEAKKLIDEFINKIKVYLSTKDKNGKTPLHLAAMSKFSLSHEIINQILYFNTEKISVPCSLLPPLRKLCHLPSLKDYLSFLTPALRLL